MSYRYLDHTADAAIEATGNTLEQAFAEAGRGMLALMIEERDFSPDVNVEIEVSAATLDDLLVEFLNELLSLQGVHDCIFTDCWVREIIPGGMDYVLVGKAIGVRPEKAKGKLGHEVKAVSYLGLKVEEKEGRFTVRTVVDL